MSSFRQLMMKEKGGGVYILNPIFATVGTNVTIDTVTGEISGFTSRPDYNYIYASSSNIHNFGLDSTNKLIFSLGSRMYGTLIGLGNRWNFACKDSGKLYYVNSLGSSSRMYSGFVVGVRYRLEYSGISAISWVLYNDETNTQLASGTITSLPSTANTNIYIGVKKDNWNGYEYQDGLDDGKFYAGTIIGGQKLVIRG